MNCFRRRPHHQRFGERTAWHHFTFRIYLQPAVRDYGAFFREPFHMRRFALEVTERNEQRKIGVAATGRLEHGVKLPLDVFPNAVTPGPNDHGTGTSEESAISAARMTC